LAEDSRNRNAFSRISSSLAAGRLGEAAIEASVQWVDLDLRGLKVEFLTNAKIQVKWRNGTGSRVWCTGTIDTLVVAPGHKHPLVAVVWEEEGSESLLDLLSTPPQLPWKISAVWRNHVQQLMLDYKERDDHPLSLKLRAVMAEVADQSESAPVRYLRPALT
jgi:hypothetical protein